MLSDKIKKLEDAVKHLKKEAELTPGIIQLLPITDDCRGLSKEQMQELWVNKYGCSKERFHNAVQAAIKAVTESGIKRIEENNKK